MSDKPWKRFEREIASQFNTKRKLAKGTSTKDDIEHDVFCVDCKAQKKWSIARWFRDLRAAASEENKIPLLICREPKKLNNERRWGGSEISHKFMGYIEVGGGGGSSG